MGELINLIGARFGRLTVLSQLPRKPKTDTLWLCRCECGELIKAKGYRLRNKQTRSCGCLKSEQQSQRQTKHGLSKHPLYYRWHHLKEQSLLCYEWHNDAKLFIEWVIDNGYKKGHSLFRINMLALYSPVNCYCAKAKDNLPDRAKELIRQARERDNKVIVDFNF